MSQNQQHRDLHGQLRTLTITVAKAIGLDLFIAAAAIVTWIILSLFHEAAHAGVCIALGGNVGGFWHWLKGAIRPAPSTDCSIKPIPPLDWAAGDVMTVLVWFASAILVAWLLKRAIIKPGFYARVVWSWWSLWAVSVLALETKHAYAPPSVWEDTTQFIHRTGVNPNFAGLPLGAIALMSIGIWGLLQYRLLPKPRARRCTGLYR